MPAVRLSHDAVVAAVRLYGLAGDVATAAAGVDSLTGDVAARVDGALLSELLALRTDVAAQHSDSLALIGSTVI